MRSLVQRKMACLLIYSAWKMAVTRPSGLRYHNTCNTVDIDFCCQNFHHLMVCWIGTNPLFFNEKKKIYSTFSARRSANEKKKRVASKKGGRFDFLVSKWNSVDVNGCLFTSKIMHTLMSIDFPTIWPSSVVVDGTPRQTIWIPFLLDRLNDWAPVRFPIDLLQPKMTWNKRTSKKYGRLTVALHFGRGFEKT